MDLLEPTTGTVERPDPDVPPYRRALPLRLLDRVAVGVDRAIGWWRLPTPLGLAVLVGLRNVMRRKNLFDTSHYPATGPVPAAPSVRYRTERAPDGSNNDPRDPRMGMAYSRFGRNVPAPPDYPDEVTDVLSPSPREVSRALLTRHEFQAARTINVLAAAWLQFMVRDWFHHEPGDEGNVWEIALRKDDDWLAGSPTKPAALRILRTPRDSTRPPDSTDPPAYLNVNSHWWDASQLYGNDLTAQRGVRTFSEGKLRLPGGAEPPVSASHDPRREPGFWLGMAMLHILFIREHNAICDRLLLDYPQWSDEELFQRARLVNAALIARIHILDWTPALIDRRTTRAGMSAIWYGIQGRRAHRLFGRLFRNPELSGIVGGSTEHFGVPYSITEEFSAVYRMHSLIPDDWTFYSAIDGAKSGHATFRDLTGLRAMGHLAAHPLSDLFYTFGVAHAGALTLHNYPKFMQEFERPVGGYTDLAATDILRTREFGVPRYNEFRRRLRLKPKKTIDELAGDPRLADEIRAVYGDDIEKVDLIVGMQAEVPPKGFAFSDTAFRIFLLMASRRLNSDRFFTTHYNARVYTPAGLDWIESNTMATVLLRHLPELRPALPPGRSAFQPFTPVCVD
jgi:hypothetical protein